jgi:K+/H+ antiporter YhaU regulatory subunit KhtT
VGAAYDRERGIHRGDEMIPNPGADTRVEGCDELIVLGLTEEVSAASALFRSAQERT